MTNTGSTENTPVSTHPAAQLLSWGTCPEQNAAKGSPGSVPGRSRTAAPPGHRCSAQSGETSQPQKSHRTWLSPFRHWQRTHSSNRGGCQQQTQLNQTQQTTGATIYCAKFSTGLSRWPHAGSSFNLKFGAFSKIATVCIPFSPRLEIFAWTETSSQKQPLYSCVSCAWHLLDSLEKTLFLPNHNAIDEKKLLSITAHSWALQQEGKA